MSGYRQFLLIGASALAMSLTGCMDGSDGAGDTAGEATAFSERPSSSRLVERDVEAPEVFQVTDEGLWDGRPSLGGVWVAYSDVTDPERVIIRNEANGKFVIGALFRREREHPGPRIQVSSDAAAALEMLAGSPTTLNITALRREEPTPEPEAAEQPVAEAEPLEDAETDATIASASAAIERAEGGEVETGEEALASVEENVEEPKRGWNPFRRKPKETDVTETAEAEILEATEELAAESVEPDLIEVAAEAEAPVIVEPAAPATKKRGWNPFKRKSTETVMPASATAGTAALASGEITATSLDGGTRSVAAEAAAAPEAIRTTSKLDKPYIQIGIFSVEQNANDTATALRQNGVSPQVYKQESSGKTFWRVVAGPANTKVDQAALLKKVKGMGFADAYAVRG